MKKSGAATVSTALAFHGFHSEALASTSSAQWWITNGLENRPSSTNPTEYQYGPEVASIKAWAGGSNIIQARIKAELTSSEAKPNAVSSTLEISFEGWLSPGAASEGYAGSASAVPKWLRDLMVDEDDTWHNYKLEWIPEDIGWAGTNCNTNSLARTATVDTTTGIISISNAAAPGIELSGSRLTAEGDAFKLGEYKIWNGFGDASVLVVYATISLLGNGVVDGNGTNRATMSALCTVTVNVSFKRKSDWAVMKTDSASVSISAAGGVFL